MKRYKKQIFSLFSLLIILAGCSRFNGIRKPLYDGEPVIPDEEALDIYQQSREVTGAEKDYYFRYPFSQDIKQTASDYPNEEPVLLEDVEYTIGEDLPAGRATLLGNESVFTSGNYDAHVGNFIIRDELDEVYFENLFHSDYGQLVAQVDLIPGHTIEIIGDDPEITVFYSSELPEDPYILMDPPELLINLDELDIQQPIIYDEATETIHLAAGIYEVGEHLEAGIYEVTAVHAVHNTEMYLFRKGEEVRVFELILSGFPEENEAVSTELVNEMYPQIELQEGDKIYPNLVSTLTLQKVSEE